MNMIIMEAVKEIESIRNEMGKEYQWKNATGEMLNQWQYFNEDDEAEEHVPKERALSDRDKMLDVLRRFYFAHSDSYEGVDDFVTLFGVYCNHYIRFNLHKAISNEDNFGIEALWDTITDGTLQKYLCLLQQGIFKGILKGINDFYNADNLLSYSLPNLYLFIYNAMAWSVSSGSKKQEFEEDMLACVEDMNVDLLNYCMKKSKFLRQVEDEEYPGDPNPLPYIYFCNEKDHEASLLAKKMANAIPIIKNMLKLLQNGQLDAQLNYKDLFEFALSLNNLYEASDRVTELYNEEDYDRVSVAPVEWRNEDGIIYRLAFLSIPCSLNWGDDVFAKLIQIMAEKEKEREEKEAIQIEKDEIVQDFTHTYKNMKTTALYRVAQALIKKENPEDRQMGRTVLLEYTRKETMTKDVYMMKLKYEHNTDQLRKILYDSCSTLTTDTQKIMQIINQSILTCLVSSFYDTGQSDARAMLNNLKKIKTWSPINKQILEFETEVIFKEVDCLSWLRIRGIDFQVSINSQWQSIGFLENGYAAVLLRNILTELFVNVFKYADIQKSIILSLAENDKALTITMANSLRNGTRNTSNSRIGIKSLERMLCVLWGDDITRIIADYTEQGFRTYIELPIGVFIRGDVN